MVQYKETEAQKMETEAAAQLLVERQAAPSHSLGHMHSPVEHLSNVQKSIHISSDSTSTHN